MIAQRQGRQPGQAVPKVFGPPARKQTWQSPTVAHQPQLSPDDPPGRGDGPGQPANLVPATTVSFLLAVMTFAVFARALGNGFVNFDDTTYVTRNPQVQAGLTWKGTAWAFTTTCAANWHPLTWLSLQLDQQLYGLDPRGYHLTSVLIHCGNAVLAFLVLRSMTGSLWRSAIVAALFAVHPLRVESVAWVSERKDVLSVFFGLLTLLAYAWYAKRPGLGRYALVVLPFALGLLAKPMLVTLPCVLLLLDYWPLGRLAPAASGPPGGERFPACRLGRLLWEKVPLFVLAAASSVLTWHAQREGEAVQSLEALPAAARIGNALISYVAYLGKTVWPARLAAFYPHPHAGLSWAQAPAAGLLLAALTAAAVMAWRWRPYLIVGWLWYLGVLVPVLGLIQVGPQAMADRYTYLPHLGLFLLATWGIADLAGRWHARGVAVALAAALLVVFMACTWVQVGYWHDTVTLWTHTIAATRENGPAERLLGWELLERERFTAATRHFREALRLQPAEAQNHFALGYALEKQGEPEEALEYFRTAYQLDPGHDILRHRFAESANNLGGLLMKQGKPQEAAEHFREALDVDPDLGAAHYNLGVLLTAQGRPGQAIDHYHAALRDDPPQVEVVHYQLGRALAQRQRWAEAAACFRQAARLGFDTWQLHAALAFALQQQDQAGAAATEYQAARRLEPRWRQKANRLAWRLATHPEAGYRDGRWALELAAQACAATRDQDADFLDTLAAAYAETGCFDRAAATVKKALALASSSAGFPKEQVQKMRQRLQLYEKFQPFRDARRPGQA